MSDWDIASQVAKLLKECYPDHPEMGQYKITHHKKPLTTFVEDPLLWCGSLIKNSKPMQSAAINLILREPFIRTA